MTTFSPLIVSPQVIEILSQQNKNNLPAFSPQVQNKRSALFFSLTYIDASIDQFGPRLQILGFFQFFIGQKSHDIAFQFIGRVIGARGVKVVIILVIIILTLIRVIIIIIIMV